MDHAHVGRHYEIVRVLERGRLIDAESFERKYCRADGRQLPPGLYVVSWPDDARELVYDENAGFIGPFKRQLHAKLTMQHLMQSQRKTLSAQHSPTFGASHHS